MPLQSFFMLLRRAAIGLALLSMLLWTGSPALSQVSNAHASPKASAAKAKTKKARARRTTRRRHHASRRHRVSLAARRARAARLRRAFIASSDLQPMAQQLATMRTPAAYAGVAAYARRHTGDAAAAAYLALGHAYLLDHRYSEALADFKRAKHDSSTLADVADFLGAEAAHNANDNATAEALLHGFAKRYPESIFDNRVPELEANALLALNNPREAQTVLEAARDTAAASRVGYELAAAQADDALGKRQQAIVEFKHVLLEHPLSGEALVARARLTQLGADSTLSLGDLRALGDAYYHAHRYKDAAEQYRALLLHHDGMSRSDRESIEVAEAACDLERGRLTVERARALPDSNDENGARRLYLLMELARDHDNETDQQKIVAEMETRFPHSHWLAEALYSSGNMYLLKRDYPNAVTYYSELADRFPNSRYAPYAHWRAAWLSYRDGQYASAAKMFNAQIRRYPDATETASALYWRARLDETRDNDPQHAAADYRAIVRHYPHYYYAMMARQRLSALGKVTTVEDADLNRFQPLPAPRLVDTFPADRPHLVKARLLANAGLNEYVAPEIRADPDSASWSALAEAQIYTSYDETFLALRSMKRALPYESARPISSIPLPYWRILFPKPWWTTIRAAAAENGLDPYLVASLIRQESEFNPNAVSYANAYGLMQLLPRVGRAMARQEGMHDFRTYQLLDPKTNIRLGTRYLREMLDRFGGVPEYALAAYNAGDNRVADWKSAGPYSGLDEFVESIPFTQTRNYVQAILRNEEMYRAIDAYAQAQNDDTRAAR